MKKLLLVLVFSFIATTAFAADWSYRLEALQRNGDSLRVVVTTILDGDDFAGREMYFAWDDVKDSTLAQFKATVDAQVIYIISQDAPEASLKDRIKQYIGQEFPITIP